MDEKEIWELVGAEGFDRLTAAFYRRVKEDAILAPMYPKKDWEGAEKRLAGFLKFRIGGEMAYVEERGHPRLRGRHMPFAIGEAERDRWLELMAGAMEEVKIVPQAAEPLTAFFVQVADFMKNK
jgi:hemoglobin